MASWRASRILKLVSPDATSHTQDNLVVKIDNTIVEDQHSTAKENAENVSPNKNIDVSSCDEILSDCDRDDQFANKIDARFISSRKTDNSSLTTHTSIIRTLQTNLVPDYDSDDSSINDNNNLENIETCTEIDQSIQKALPKSSSSSSSTSSSSSSNSTSSGSSSSDSDSSTSSKRTNQHSEQYANGVRPQSASTSTLPANISPNYTDESDNIDLSDDDPTFNYELSTKRKKKNYFFDATKTDSSDSDDDSVSDSDRKKLSKRGRKRSLNPAKWKQNKVKKLRNTGESYISISKSQKVIPSRCLKVPCTDKCRLKCTTNISMDESTDEKKRELEDKYNKHIEEKSLSRIEKQEDRKKVTKDNIVAIYDLEAVLQCPRGHTQNEADSVHSLIEKEIKKNLKSGPIYSPDQYIALIKNAKKSKPAINVHELTFDSFVDTKILQEEWGYNYNTNMDGQTVNWNNIKVLMMKKEKPFSIFYKTSYKDDCFQEIDVRNKRKKMKLITEITLKKAYTERQDISLNKKKDLRDLVNKGLIPPFYANFYNSIIN
ncbi:unnamed protein product [Spodoptera exigua]|nr:unnamed protein product [Spodoptera exigua]